MHDPRSLGRGGARRLRMGPWVVAVTAAGMLAACSGLPQPDLAYTPGTAATPTDAGVRTTPMPPPPETLIVCLAREPESLYLYSPLRMYGEAGRETDVVLQALYDGPMDLREFYYAPTILERIPSLENGDARIEQVEVTAGEVYLNPQTLNPDSLERDRPYLPSGCGNPACVQTYRGGSVTMDRLSVDFRLRAGLTWSDGEPLTAQDSEFSFRLNAQPGTPISKYLVDRTYSYEALDESSVRWIGIPGFMDSEYPSSFWTPLPEHVLDALPVEEIPTAEAASRAPIGWGPYVVQEWIGGDQITLVRNPRYFRSGEGLPRFERLIFRFVGAQTESGIQQLITGECDILDETAISVEDLSVLAEQEQAGRILVQAVPGALVERIDLNLAPLGGAPALFADSRTREALAGCIDRQGLVSELLLDLGELTESYLPTRHPLYPMEWGFAHDPDAAQTLLDEVGWRDHDGLADTPRVAQGVSGVPNGTPLAFVLLAEAGGLSETAADQIAQDLAECGIEATVEARPADQLTAPWPEGAVFGRTFQAVIWPWLTWASPACELFASREIPRADYPNGSNATGFSDPEYDQACGTLMLSLPETSPYVDAAVRHNQILREGVPAIPLFVLPRIVASRPEICGLEVDPSGVTALWNLEVLGTEPACEGG